MPDMTEDRPFDCDKDCPQHGRNDQRISTLERIADDCRAERKHIQHQIDSNNKDIWREIDLMKDNSNKYHNDLNRRIGEKVPTRYGITLIVLIVGIFTTIIGINIASNTSVNDKLDKLSKEVAVLQTITTERSRQTMFYTELLKEIRMFRENQEDDKMKGN